MRREKREREERPRRRVGFKTILHFIEIVVIAAAVVFVANRFAPKSETQITSSFISDKLEMVSELTTAKLTYNGLVYYSDGSIPLLTQKSFTMTYRAEVRAGVDLSQATVDMEGSTVRITLPQAAILSHEIDEDSVEVFDEKTSIFNPFTVEDFSSFQADQKKAMEEKALGKGLLDEAQAKAEASVRQLLSPALPEGTELEVSSVS